jgi:uncharacterized protein (TIGR00255 family)
MTGYGKAETVLEKTKISIELKSLNSKQLDLNIRMPYSFNSKEIELRSLISKKLERGKISVFLNVEYLGEKSNHSINKELVELYYNQLRELANKLGNSTDNLLESVMKLPDVVKQVNEKVDENEWKEIIKLTEEALKKQDEFRVQEGATLEEDFRLRIANIIELLKQVDKYENLRIETIKERMQQSLNKHFDEASIDKNRFEQELIFYFEKLDITEEKIRLRKHCDYFIETLNEKIISKGKKLGFILQEIGREINTLGSKSNNQDMQKIVVQMKDELEKIKEQALNIL